jgi:hypothetical protein
VQSNIVAVILFPVQSNIVVVFLFPVQSNIVVVFLVLLNEVLLVSRAKFKFNELKIICRLLILQVLLNSSVTDFPTLFHWNNKKSGVAVLVH